MQFPKIMTLIAAAFAFSIFQSCADLSTSSDNTGLNSDTPKSEQMILGNKLQDPYTVESMKKALVSLAERKGVALGKKRLLP